MTTHSGGAGMVMMVQPLSVRKYVLDNYHENQNIYLSPQGIVLTQD